MIPADQSIQYSGQFYRAVGLMSGSSLDGVDLVACEFNLIPEQDTGTLHVDWNFRHGQTVPFTSAWKERLLALPNESARIFAQTHVDFGHYLGTLVASFTTELDFQPHFIASHGHTIFHDPANHWTSQIGDGAAIAAQTGVLVIDQFRNLDVARGGQGAPIAPIADRLLFPNYDFYLNLGGIVNISCVLPHKTIAFDIGGANQMLNALADTAGLEFDEDGKLAASGKLDQALYDALNATPFFENNYPKSLSNSWVQENMVRLVLDWPAALNDKLYTVCQHIGYQVQKSIKQIQQKESLSKLLYSMFLTGGGAFNTFLCSCIQQACPQVELVIPPIEHIQFKEALLMALMGGLRLGGYPNCIATVTGSEIDSIGGAVHDGRVVD